MKTQRRGGNPGLAAIVRGTLWVAAAILVAASREEQARSDCAGFNYFSCFLYDTSDSPGYLSSLAENGVLVAYHGMFKSDLKFAKLSSPATITIVDSTGSVGDFPSMVVDTLDHETISYYDVSKGDLKVAEHSGGVWNLSRVDSVGRVGLYTSIKRVAGGLAIAYFDSTKGDLKYAEKNRGFGGWTLRTIDSIGVVGMYASLAVNGSSRGISYYDSTNGNLRFASRTGGVWTSVAVDAPGNVGGYTSLFSRSPGYGVAYYDFTNQNLKFGYSTTGGASWITQVVDAPGDVGTYASASAFGSTPGDSIGISYYDATKHDLKYAQKIGLWGSFAVDTADDVGRYTSCVTGQDTVSIAYRAASYGSKLAWRRLVHTGAPDGRISASGARVSWSRSAHGPGGLIRYAVPISGPVLLRIFDPQGRIVREVLDRVLPAGEGQARWDGRDLRGRLVASGVLYVRIDTATGSASAPAVVLR